MQLPAGLVAATVFQFVVAQGPVRGGCWHCSCAQRNGGTEAQLGTVRESVVAIMSREMVQKCLGTVGGAQSRLELAGQRECGHMWCSQRADGRVRSVYSRSFLLVQQRRTTAAGAHGWDQMGRYQPARVHRSTSLTRSALWHRLVRLTTSLQSDGGIR